MSNNQLDLAEWKQRFDSAQQRYLAARERMQMASENTARERTQFFEKIAIGAGAAITALVSFLGARGFNVHPRWILQAALILLAAAMLAALARNYLYPYYALYAHLRIYKEKERRMENVRAESYSVVPVQQEITGRSISSEEMFADARAEDTNLEQQIDDAHKREQRFSRLYRAAETLCVVTVAVAMMALIGLTFSNI